MNGSQPKKTGLVCPAFKKPVAVIEYQTPTTLTMRYPCGHRWSGSVPGAKPH